MPGDLFFVQVFSWFPLAENNPPCYNVEKAAGGRRSFLQELENSYHRKAIIPVLYPYRRKTMVQTTLKIDGMMCGMCESHINDAIRKDFFRKESDRIPQQGYLRRPLR